VGFERYGDSFKKKYAKTWLMQKNQKEKKTEWVLGMDTRKKKRQKVAKKHQEGLGGALTGD